MSAKFLQPEKFLKKRFYQVNCDGRTYFKKFQTKEKAEKFAIDWLSHQNNVIDGRCEIYLVEETLQVVEEL